MSGNRGVAVERVLQALRRAGSETRQNGAGDKAQCPVHDDHEPSLGVTQWERGARVRCWSQQCPQDQVLAALGLAKSDLYDDVREREDRQEWTPKGPAVAVYDYTDENGVVLFQVCRTAGKEFPQRRPDPAARSGWRWKLDGARRVPYHLPQLLAGVRDGKTIFVVEGEKDVHAVEAAGGVSTTPPGGAHKRWPREFDHYFADASVVVVADKDEPGRKKALEIATCLRGAGASVQIAEALEGKDAADHLAAGHGLDTFGVVQSEPAERPAGSSSSSGEPVPGGAATEGGRPPSAATVIVDIAEQIYEFGVSETGEAYGIPRSDPKLVYLLRGGRKSLRAQLSHEYRRRLGKVAADGALADAMLVIQGIAQEADPRPLHLRVARHDGAIWLDLGDDTGRAVRISADGWSIENGAPVLFKRTALTANMPAPIPGGRLGELWEWLNVGKTDRPLVAAHLASAFDPDVQHPALGIFGEHGTAKSSASKILVQLTDPSPVPNRKPPKDAEAWVTAAAGSWVVSLDNLSAIPDWLSDSLCRAVTGEGDVRRKLYTDGDLAVFAFLRVVILNGIDVGPMRGDLIDRMLPIHLDLIPDDRRMEEVDFWREFDAARPRLLGALLDLTAGVMRDAPSVALPAKPRMASFARVLAAIDQALGTEGLDRYQAKQRGMAAETLTADPFVTRMRAALTSSFFGTSKKLLEDVTPADDGWRRPRGWPASARALTGLLRRQAPGMRKTGWEIQEEASGHDNAVRWSITPPGDDGEAGSRPSQDSQGGPDQHDPGAEGASDAGAGREFASYQTREAEAANSHAAQEVFAGHAADASDASLASDDSDSLRGNGDSFWAGDVDGGEWAS